MSSSFFLVTPGRTVFVPIWTEVPTEIEWQMQKEAEVQKILNGMSSSVEQFKVALNGDVNPEFYFIEAAEVDFVGLMVDYNSFVKSLDGEYEKSFYKILYDFIERELDYFSEVDQSDLVLQCKDDPWNIVFTPITFEKYPEIPELCKGVIFN